MPTPQIEILGRNHRPLLKAFRNQHPSLVGYLQRYALRHQEKDHLSRTFVAMDDTPGGRRIAGYFSLSTVSVERQSVAPLPSLDRLPQFPVPGVLLARLAVDERVQGQGLGRFLFDEALGHTLRLAADGPLAFRLLVTDAIDQDAVRFYEKFALKRLSDTFPCRMVLDLKPILGPS